MHLLAFKLLDKKRAEGPGSIPQSYVATMSLVLGLLFRSSLCASLTIAFTQALWRLLRLKALSLSSIEVLFKITQNPIMLFFPEGVKATKILFLLALFSWTLPIAITFPPGALIVVSTSEDSVSSISVPTYDGAFMGNGTGYSARQVSLAIRRGGGSAYIYRCVMAKSMQSLLKG
jgi:hypothetical protein